MPPSAHFFLVYGTILGQLTSWGFVLIAPGQTRSAGPWVVGLREEGREAGGKARAISGVRPGSECVMSFRIP